MDATKGDKAWVSKENPSVAVAGERCSGSCSSASETFLGEDSKYREDRMVKIELDAARTLADFSQLLLFESENPRGQSRGKWSNKGRRSKKRVKSESPAMDWENSEIKSLTMRSLDLVQDRSIMIQRLPKKVCENVTTRTVKVEQDAELPEPGALHSIGGGKSRQSLTEAEKEARKLRRVLANRESARQTILRRQALCEELTRKAAELTWDNESMKREMELVIKEYQLLKVANKRLKAQMAKTVKAEVDDTIEEPVSTHIDSPSSPSTKLPFLVYRPQFSPFLWPSIIQNLPVQTQQVPQNSVLSKDLVLTTGPNPSPEPGNPSSINGPRTPFFILPCPWLFSHPDHRNGLHPCPLDALGLRDKQYEAYENQNNEGSSSKAIEKSLPIRVKTEAFSSTETRPINNPPDPSEVFPPVGGQLLRPHPKGMILTPTPIKCLRTKSSLVECENGLQPEPVPNEETFSSTGSHVLPEKKQESNILLNKRLVDASAAAEARKRRREITKLKNLHGRQHRMHY